MVRQNARPDPLIFLIFAPVEFAAALNRAKELVPLLVETYDALSRYSREHFAECEG